MGFLLPIYFSAKEFKENFNNDFEKFRKVYTDADLSDFINENIELYSMDYINIRAMYATSILPKQLEKQDEYTKIIEQRKAKFTFSSILKYLNERSEEILFTGADNLIIGKTVIPLNPKQETQIKWHGNQTEFIELIKALIENGTLKGTQKEIIQKTSDFFNIEIKNPDKLLQDIKKRNTGSTTLFIDSLKSNLYDYITK